MEKILSLATKALACVFVLSVSIFFLWQNKILSLEQVAPIIYIGLFIALSFFPIDLSFLLEKIISIFSGQKIGKTLSLFSKLISFLCVVCGFIFIFLKNNTINLEQTKSLVLAGLFIALVFSPVDISIWLEKLTQLFGGKGDEKNG